MFRKIFVLVLALVLTGCSNDVLGKKNSFLAHGSNNQKLMLQPNTTVKRTVFLQLQNDQINYQKKLEKELVSKGITIVTQPEQAQYVLQVQIRHLGLLSSMALQEAMQQEYGQPLPTVNAGLAPDDNAVLALITDVRIAERIKNNRSIRHYPKRGEYTETLQIKWKPHSTRLVTHVPSSKGKQNQAALLDNAIQSISQIF